MEDLIQIQKQPLNEGVNQFKSLQYQNVLVVEDDTSTTRLIKVIARSANEYVRIKSFASGQDANSYLKYLKEYKVPGPDLALVDFYLRGHENGLQVCQILEKMFPETQIVMMSSTAPEEMRSKMKEYQVQPMYLLKPFTIQQLTQIFRVVH